MVREEPGPIPTLPPNSRVRSQPIRMGEVSGKRFGHRWDRSGDQLTSTSNMGRVDLGDYGPRVLKRRHPAPSGAGLWPRANRRRQALWTGGLCILSLSLAASPVAAQEVIGKRFLSDTLVISEPFVEDELSLPSILHIRRPATDSAPRTLVTNMAAELKKRLTPSLELSVAGGLTHLDPDGKPTLTGFDNLQLGLKYQYFISEAHELVLSAGVVWEIGGTGRTATGAESFDVVNPALLFGKGLGDLPDTLSVLKPLAIEGVLGAVIPTQASTRVSKGASGTGGPAVDRHPDLLQWGLVVEYSLPYLQTHVRNLGLPAPLNRIFPLVEFDLQTALDRGVAGRTTGTANPGLVWAVGNVQVGLEAVLPLNDRTGKTLGVRAFLRVDLDTFLPGLGRPLFGGSR